MADKIYAPINAKERTFQDGGAVLNMSGKADNLIAWINEHTNETGYINMTVAKRKAVGKYGETHAVYLNPWRPQPRGDQQPATGVGDESQF